MNKSLVLIIIACVFSLTFFLSRGESKLSLSFNPANHPDVINVENMIDKTGISVEPNIKKKVALAIAEHARYYGIKPKNLVAIAFVESRFQPNVINRSGDHGLMQINWPTWKNRFTNDPNDLLNVYKNVEVACKIININKSMGFADIASYHSFNDEPRAEYAARIKKVLGRL